MFHPRVILHPTDFSENSNYAFHIATDLSRQHKAKLLVLHVAETLGAENVTYGEATSRLEPEYLLAAGEPAHEISRVAREQSCDLIVMGTHGLSGLSRLLMGSIADRVIRLAPCPILISKSPA